MGFLEESCGRWPPRFRETATRRNYEDAYDQIIRRFAGAFVLISLVLAHYHSPNWLWFTAFVGFNLLQSSFTNFCPLEIILKKFGVGKEAGSCCDEKQPAA